MDLDAGIILEDKPKETITKRDLTNILGKKMNLKITLYTDVDSQPTQSPDPGEFHTTVEDVIDERSDWRRRRRCIDAFVAYRTTGVRLLSFVHAVYTVGGLGIGYIRSVWALGPLSLIAA